MLGRGQATVDQLPAALVYAGFSLGVLPAQMLAQTRPGAKGALFYHSCVPTSEFDSVWPTGVPVQIHGMDADPFFAGEGDIDAARALVKESPDAELFVYPGEEHLFADNSLPSYDPAAAAAPHRAHARVPRRDPLTASGRQRVLPRRGRQAPLSPQAVRFGHEPVAAGGAAWPTRLLREASAGQPGQGGSTAGGRSPEPVRECRCSRPASAGPVAGPGARVVDDRGREAVGQQVADLLQQQDVLGRRGRLRPPRRACAARPGRSAAAR